MSYAFFDNDLISVKASDLLFTEAQFLQNILIVLPIFGASPPDTARAVFDFRQDANTFNVLLGSLVKPLHYIFPGFHLGVFTYLLILHHFAAGDPCGVECLIDLLRRPQVSYDDLRPFDPAAPELPGAVREQVEISVKYEGYIRRQMAEVEEFTRLESRLLPEELDYSGIDGLRLEAREKLAAIRPRSLGQAGRISGVSPADLAALMIFLEKEKRHENS